MTLNVHTLPHYSKGEEIANSITHFLGFLFGLGTLISFIIIGINKQYDFVHMIPFYVYSLFMMLMFFVSGFYHSRKFNSKSRALSRIIDHADIYLFVAATYFPICMYGITNEAIRIALLAIEVSLGLIGVLLNVLPFDNIFVKVITFLIYIVQGWAIIVFYPFNTGLDFTAFLFILIGGIVYTVGTIMYGFGKYKKWSHSWFHIFVLIAAILQFVGILFIC